MCQEWRCGHRPRDEGVPILGTLWALAVSENSPLSTCSHHLVDYLASLDVQHDNGCARNTF